MTYTWSFGDGSANGTSSPVDHTFPTLNPSKSKTYSVQLTAANSCGNTNQGG